MTYSLLRLGEPRLKGRVRGEPVIKGPGACTTLQDSGFEFHLAQTGGGPGGDEIPTVVTDVDVTQAVWSDDTAATPYGWFGFGPSTRRPHWTVEITDPRSGTYHAEQIVEDLSGVSTWSMMAYCLSSGAGRLHTRQVTEGQIVTATGWAKSTPNGIARLGMEFWSSEVDGSTTFGFLESATTGLNTTSSYQQVTHEVSVPATAKYVGVFIQATEVTGQTVTYRVDDCTLAVA